MGVISVSSPSSLAGVRVRGGRGFSASLSELGPLDLSWWTDGGGGVGVVADRGVAQGGKAGVLSKPLVFPSGFPVFCTDGACFFAGLAPFLAFLNRTEVRRPTPAIRGGGGVSREGAVGTV